MKKGICLAGIVSFICYMGEAQQVVVDGNAQCSSDILVEGSDDLRAFASVAKSVFFCREACNETLNNDGKTCWKICGGIFSRFYHEELAKESEVDKHEKEDICEDIYRRSYIRETCYNLPYSLVQLMEEIHDTTIEDPDTEDLQEMDMNLFSAYGYISIEPLDYNVDRYSSREAKDFLFWLAHPGACNLPIADMIFNIDKRFKILDELLEIANLHPFEDTINETYLSTFFDLINQAKNKKTGEWFHNFIKEECEHDTETDKLCVLETYCSLSKSMSDEVAKGFVDFPYFKNFINNIISGEVNKSNWSRQDLQSHENLDSWHKDLCQ